MFAMAIWDGRARELWLVRDRIGIKPLYWSVHHGRLVFASEIKALLEDPGQAREVHEEALYHYLSFLTTPAPQTLFQLVETRWNDEEHHGLGMRRSDLSSSLDFDFEQNVIAGGEVIHHRLAQGSVLPAVVFRPFQELSSREQRREFVWLQEPVMDPVSFSRT